jgi:hypothetical protein
MKEDDQKLAIIENSANQVRLFLESSGFQDTIRHITEASTSVRSLMQGIVPVIETVSPFMEMAQRIREREDFTTVRYITPPRPVTAHEVELILEGKIERALAQQNKTSVEILFTKDKNLIRKVVGHELRYSFVNNRKRRVFFDALYDQGGYISTRSLQELVKGRTESSLRKMVQELNRDVRLKLKLKENIIESHRGSGYRISEKITVINE